MDRALALVPRYISPMSVWYNRCVNSASLLEGVETVRRAHGSQAASARRAALALSAVAVVLACLAVGAFAYLSMYEGPLTLPRLYHNAQDVAEKVVEREPPAGDVRIVTFLTSDEVDVVREYYHISMQEWRWSTDGCDNTGGANRCSYVQLLDGASRRVDIAIEPAGNGMAKVIIEMSSRGLDWNGALPRK